jgi:hypothetical protein
MLRRSPILLTTLLALSLSAQQKPTIRYIGPMLRVDQMTDETNGFVHFCVAVKQDGAFHMEREFSGYDAGSKIKVFEGKLEEQELEQVKNFVNTDDFRSIKNKPRTGMVRMNDSEMLTVSVLRDEARPQFFSLAGEDQKPYKNALKPLHEWLKSLKKRKLQEAKEVKPTNCNPEDVEKLLNPDEQ